jgi:hypothetical protein
VQDDAPAGPGLLIELVHFKRDAGRLGQFRQDPVGQSAKVDRALVHGVRDRQDLREIGCLPRNPAQVMGLDEIKALLAAYRFKAALRPVIGIRPSGSGRADHGWVLSRC